MTMAVNVLLYAVLLSGSTEKEHRLRLEYDDLAAHAGALLDVAEQVESELRQRGETLHPEIAEARNHLIVAMNSAAEALDEQNWNLLRKRLDRARGWMEKLKRRL
jgi:hypothetical protein